MQQRARKVSGLILLRATGCPPSSFITFHQLYSAYSTRRQLAASSSAVTDDVVIYAQTVPCQTYLLIYGVFCGTLLLAVAVALYVAAAIYIDRCISLSLQADKIQVKNGNIRFGYSQSLNLMRRREAVMARKNSGAVGLTTGVDELQLRGGRKKSRLDSPDNDLSNDNSDAEHDQPDQLPAFPGALSVTRMMTMINSRKTRRRNRGSILGMFVSTQRVAADTKNGVDDPVAPMGESKAEAGVAAIAAVADTSNDSKYEPLSGEKVITTVEKFHVEESKKESHVVPHNDRRKSIDTVHKHAPNFSPHGSAQHIVESITASSSKLRGESIEIFTAIDNDARIIQTESDSVREEVLVGGGIGEASIASRMAVTLRARVPSSETPSQKMHRKLVHGANLKNIFLFQRPKFFFMAMEVLMLFQSFYVAVMTTQLIPIVQSSGQNWGWIVGLVLPNVLTFLVIQITMNKAVLLRSVYKLDREIAGRVVEDRKEEVTAIEKLRDSMRLKLLFEKVPIEDWKDHLKEYFFQYDRKKTGLISPKDFLKILGDLGIYMTLEKFRFLWRAVDYDLSGFLDWDEVLHIFFPNEIVEDASSRSVS